MKKINVYTSLFFIACVLAFTSVSYGQDEVKDYAEIYIYRIRQNAMNGLNPLETKVTMNGHVIGTLSNATKLKYRIYSEGEVKIKCFLAYSEGGIGKPYVVTLDVERGKEYHIKLKTISLSGPGVTGEILTDKKITKIQKAKFDDENEYEEDKENPIIEKK